MQTSPIVFFAGHGIEVNGTNYLIPVDAVLEHDIDVQDEALSLDRVSQALEPAKRLRLIMLDACRDNPFVRSIKRTAAGRSIGRGLAAVEVFTSDTLIAYAARAGYTASDGSGTNSPYTLALLNHLTTPGLDVRLALGRVRDEVLKSTGNRQEPFVYGSLGGAEIALVAAKVGGAKAAEPAVSQRLSEAAEAWAATRDTGSIVVLEAFVTRYKDTFYVELAKLRIEELKKQQAKAEPLKPVPKTDTFAPISKPLPVSGEKAWVKLCEKATDAAKSVNACLTHHERVDGNTGMVLVSAAVRQMEGKEHLTVMVPLGMQQPPGMRVTIFPKDQWAKVLKNDTNEKIDESKVKSINFNYSLCHPGGCTGEVEANPELIADLKVAGGMLVYAIDAAGSPVGFPVPLNGFEEAYAGAPVDTKTHAEARKKLMQEIAARQAEAARAQGKQKTK